MAAQRPLGLVCYGTGAVDGIDLAQHSELFPLLKSFGLPATERWWIAASVDETLAAIRELDRVRHDFVYQTDGAVVKVDSLRATRGAWLHREITAVGDRLQIRSGTRRNSPA